MNSINENWEFGRRDKKTFYLCLEPAPDQDLDKPCWRDRTESALPTVPQVTYTHLILPPNRGKANRRVSVSRWALLGRRPTLFGVTLDDQNIDICQHPFLSLSLCVSSLPCYPLGQVYAMAAWSQNPSVAFGLGFEGWVGECRPLPQLWMFFPFSSQTMWQWQWRGLDKPMLTSPRGD